MAQKNFAQKLFSKPHLIKSWLLKVTGLSKNFKSGKLSSEKMPLSPPSTRRSDSSDDCSGSFSTFLTCAGPVRCTSRTGRTGHKRTLQSRANSGLGGLDRQGARRARTPELFLPSGLDSCFSRSRRGSADPICSDGGDASPVADDCSIADDRFEPFIDAPTTFAEGPP
jgi:hypothetical protein